MKASLAQVKAATRRVVEVTGNPHVTPDQVRRELRRQFRDDIAHRSLIAHLKFLYENRDGAYDTDAPCGAG